MDPTAKFLLECLVAISVICCIIYFLLLARKSMDERSNPFHSDSFAKCGVIVRYEDAENPMWIHFYTEGIALERSNGKKLYILNKNIIGVEQLLNQDRFEYRLSFNLDGAGEDVLDILCTEKLMDEFIKAVSAEKVKAVN